MKMNEVNVERLLERVKTLREISDKWKEMTGGEQSENAYYDEPMKKLNNSLTKLSNTISNFLADTAEIIESCF